PPTRAPAGLVPCKDLETPATEREKFRKHSALGFSASSLFSTAFRVNELSPANVLRQQIGRTCGLPVIVGMSLAIESTNSAGRFAIRNDRFRHKQERLKVQCSVSLLSWAARGIRGGAVCTASLFAYYSTFSETTVNPSSLRDKSDSPSRQAWMVD